LLLHVWKDQLLTHLICICSGKLKALSPANGNGTEGWFPRARMPTPDGLRVHLKCQKGSAGGVCAAMVRLKVQFEGNMLHEGINAFEKLSEQMERDENYTCDERTWLDTDGLLGVS
jgi:hypothetical protein